ncbi:MAG TPA: bacillithiol biosynthesis cysteine-adding enzyme BshC [Ignavibacteria bacterium]|nr:bacillithiol biosynthesis cysteine-adding enzyme BshC [Ignavibacteria bacterium]HMR41662.1 bacillithiol biosynthesis cysteine-adding enzyme BshC [Ignavibacteria bacterium]
MSIPYSSLPSYSDLFLKYTENFESLSKFYEFNFKKDEDFQKCIELKKETYIKGKSFFRNEITDILKVQNAKFGSHEKTFENILLLNDHNTFAVVTGQQIGILSGPYYTILKALNTIQLSEQLKTKFPEYNFVPVFWLEADDHDFTEINNINIISKENELKNIKYFEKGTEQEKYLQPVGGIILDEHIETFKNELLGSYHNSDFTENLFNSINESYKEGNDLITAFALFMNDIIKDKGLIFIDPTDIELKKMLQPVFKTELTTFPDICEKVIDTSVELEENFAVQVKPKAINLFYIHEGNRYLIEPREDDIFALKHSRQKFSREELTGLLETNPERFSWNVVTRPICQDYLLPTVAYIGGPSEIAYFGQFRQVYEYFEITMPVIYPRTSVTILESRVKNFMEKFNIRFDEFFDEKEIGKKLLNENSDISADQIFSDLKEELRAVFYTYEKELLKIDNKQTEGFSKRNNQFLESLEIAKEKFISAQSKQNEVISNQLRKALLFIFPDNTLQERILNISYFLNKYGPDIIEHLISEIIIDDFGHQVIEVPANRI